MSNIDPIDKMLQEDDPSAQQAKADQQIERIETQSDEEVEFNKMSGSAQERFRTALARAREAEEEAAALKAQNTYNVPQAPEALAPQQKQAIETLREFGISTKDDVKAEVNQGINQIKWDLRQADLESRYTGQNGEPQYVREEVEDYMKKHPKYLYYDPEDVFKMKMFPDEFSGTQSSPKKSQSLKPTRSNQQASPLSDIDALQKRLDEPDGDEYYEAHKDEINKAVKEHTDKFKGVNFGGQ